MNPTSKICTKCGVEKTLEEFHKAKYGKHGRAAKCRACVKIYAREHNAKPEVRKRSYATRLEYRKAHREVDRAYSKQYRKDNFTKEEIAKSNSDYYQTHKKEIAAQSKLRCARPEVQYKQQQTHAKQREIEFNLTFDQWYSIWVESGHYEDRGKRIGQYCMSRCGDKGAYEVGNVFIQLHSKNVSDGFKHRAKK